MPGPVFLRSDPSDESRTATIELRTVEDEDLEFVQEHINDPDVWSHLGSATPKNRKDEEAWLESITGGDEGVHLLVCDDGEPVGEIGMEVRETWGTAELGYWVAPHAQGNGYCTEAVRLMARYGIEERRLNKIVAEAYGYNTGSRRVLEKAGFTEEGVHREEAFAGGEYRDIVHYGLLAEEL